MSSSKKRKIEESDTEESDIESESESESEYESESEDEDDAMEVDEQPSTASQYKKEVDSNLRLDDLGGLKEIKYLLKASIIFPFLDKAREHNNPPPKGILFYGPPGTGKTQMALRLISEMNRNLKGIRKKITFYSLEAGDIKSKYFGESEKILKDLFADAVKNKPSVIFLDEIDALACSRETSREEANLGVASCILTQFNNFKPGEVLVIGTTNMLNKIDPALLRSGRMSKKLQFLPPTEKGRFDIISRIVKAWKRDVPNLQLIHKLAKLSSGFTGADLHDLCSEAVEAARIRKINNTKREDSILEELKSVSVTEVDWMETLKTIRPTNVNCYGGYNFQWSGLDYTNIRSLIEDNKTKILQMLTEESIKSLLIETEYSIDDLNNYILPSALESIMSQYDIFVAECIQVLNNEKTIFTMFREAADAALASRKKSILVFKRIDTYWKDLSEEQKDYLSVKLRDMRNKNNKLVATSTTPLNDLKCPKLKKLFQSEWCIEIEKYSDENIKNCFDNLKDDGVEKLVNMDQPKKGSRVKNKRARPTDSVNKENLLKQEFDRLLVITKDYTIDEFSKLHEKLSTIISDSNHKTSNALIKDVRNHLDTLETSK